MARTRCGPDLLAAYDDGAWVAVLLEDVEGRHPDLGDDTTMENLLRSTDELTRVMNQRLPDAPRPPPPPPGDTRPALFRPGPVDLSLVFDEWRSSVEQLPELPDDLAPPWLRDYAAELCASIGALAAMPMRNVVHWDIRDDNLLLRPSGEIVFLDWGAFGVGPGLAGPDSSPGSSGLHLPWFDTSLATSPALLRAGDDVVTSWLAGVGTHLALRAHVAVDVNLPTLAAFRRQESARFLGAAARRLGVGDLGARARRC